MGARTGHAVVVEVLELTSSRARPHLSEVRDLLGVAFEGDLSAEDWEHALGGVHVVALEDGEVIGHVAVVERSLSQGARAWRTGYVEALAVHPKVQRRGHGTRLMTHAEAVIAANYELGALSASDVGAPLYERRGWRRLLGRTWANTPEGRVRTHGDDGSVFVLPLSEPAPDVHGELACDFRTGDLW